MLSVFVWDNSLVVLVGNELLTGVMCGIVGHQESLWFSPLVIAVPSVCLFGRQVFLLQDLSSSCHVTMPFF